MGRRTKRQHKTMFFGLQRCNGFIRHYAHLPLRKQVITAHGACKVHLTLHSRMNAERANPNRHKRDDDPKYAGERRPRANTCSIVPHSPAATYMGQLYQQPRTGWSVSDTRRKLRPVPSRSPSSTTGRVDDAVLLFFVLSITRS